MMNLFLGILGENTGGLVYGNLYKLFGSGFNCYLAYPFCYSFDLNHTNQFIFWNVFYFFSFKVDSVLVINLLTILTVVLSIYFFSRLYKTFISSKILYIILAVLALMSPYFYYQLPLHYDLAQVWLFVLQLLIVFKSTKFKHYALSGVLLGLTFSFSNYIGLFSAAFISLFMISKIILTRHLKKSHLLNLVLYLVVGLIVTYIVSIPYINYFKVSGSPVGSDQYRSISDYYIFTSRPWYYVLPPQDNPFFGHITYKTLNYLTNDQKIFLAQNYFKSEHSASFLGITNLVIGAIGMWSLIKRKKILSDFNKYALIGMTFGAIGLFVISMPPIFPLMPSYILWKVFPVFRVLARSGIFILLTLLIYTGLGYEYLLKSYSKFKYVFPFLIVISVMEFYVPIKISFIKSTPEIFQYISLQTPKDTLIASYPYEKSNQMLFWQTKYQRKYLNIRDFKSTDGAFSSDIFTKNLNTDMGLENAKAIGVKYIVVFAKDSSSEETTYFAKTPKLRQIGVFGDTSEPVSKICNSTTTLIRCFDTGNIGESYLYEVI